MKRGLPAVAILSLALLPGLGRPRVAGATPATEYPGQKQFNSCKKLPAGKAALKLNFKPDTEVADLIRWISGVTCTSFLVSSTVPLQGRKVTIIAPEAITPDEAYRLFFAALDSVNLTVEPAGKFLRIVETRH